MHSPDALLPSTTASPLSSPRARGRGRSLWQRLFTLEQWSVGSAPVSIDAFLDNPSATPFRWIAPPNARHILADPFGIEEDGQLLILAEAMDHAVGRGVLVALDPEQTSACARPVLDAPHHLSYPFVVRVSDDVFVMPEQGESGELSLYPWAEGRLGAARPLTGEALIDPTLYEENGRWWLFATKPGPTVNSALHLYFADALTGPYRPHPNNPIVVDAGCARPAGRLIRHRGRLLRPGQDCRQGYGGAIVLCAIDTLSPTAYGERPVARIEPAMLGGYGEGCHTLDHTARHVLVDSKRTVFHPLAWLFKLRAKLRA